MITETDIKGKMSNSVMSIPTRPISYEAYDPANITVWDKYIEIGDERKTLERAIKKARFPYLIESEKGQGKTLLIHTICKENGIALIEEPVGSGTKSSDLIGTVQIDREGTWFKLGLLPLSIMVANHFGHAVMHGDDGNAQDHEIQKWWNSICDGRKGITVNGKQYKLNKGCKLSIVWTINPITYSGVNSMNEDLRSRFIGRVWDYPSNSDFEKVINWENIPPESVKDPLLTLAQDTHSLKVKGDVEYALSIRDMAQFVDHLRDLIDDTTVKEPLNVAIKEVILIKYNDVTERELIRNRCNDTFGVNI